MALEGAQLIEWILKLKMDPASAEYAKTTVKVVKDGLTDLAATAEKGSNAATTLTKKLGDINRANQVEKLGKDFGVMAGKIGDADKAAALLAGRLADIGASTGEIEKAGQAFANAQNGGGGIGGNLSIEGLKRSGGALSQIGLGGAGSAVSSVGSIAELVKEFQQLSSVIPGVTTLTATLTPALGATAAGFAAVLAPVGLVALALAPLIIAFKLLSDQAAATQKAFEDQLAAEVAANELKKQNIEIEKTRTSEQNRDKAAADQEAFNIQRDFVNKLKADREEITRQYNNSSNPFERNDLAGKGQKLDKQIEDETQKEIDLGTAIENTVRVLGPAIDQREKEEAAIKKEADALKAKEQAIADAGKVELEARQLAKTATEEQVRALLDQIALQREVLAGQAKAQEDLGQSSKQYTDQIVMLDARTKALTETTLKAAQANDRERESKKSLEEAGKAAKKYYDDVASVNEKFAENQADIAQKLIDKQADIQAQAVEAASQLLANLQQKQGELQKNLGREFADQDTKRQNDNLQRQIDFARKDVTAEKKAQDDILAIKRKAKEDEFSLALDRDFAGLARSRRQTLSQVSDVSKQAQSDRQERLVAFQQQSEDQNRAFINERQQKIVQYQRAQADAQEAYKRDQVQLAVNRNRALVAAQQANQKELQVLNDKHQKELSAKYAAAKAEIDLAQKSSAVRNQILTAEYQHALSVFQGVSRSGGGGGRATLTAFANGGNLSAGNFGAVNEPGSSGRESITGSGKTYNLPGAGVFFATNNSTVNPNKGGAQMVTLAPTFNISGSDPNAVMKVIDDKLEQSIKRIFKVKATS
jgi:hypothetical protein